jgi:SAM-dependent methyltransferase
LLVYQKPPMPVSKEFAPSIFHPFYFVRRGLLRAMQEHAGQFHGKMLDFGCGSKPYKSLFKVDEYIGIDYENPGHPHDNEQIDIFYDGRNIPLPDAHFDCALSSEVFEHIFNPHEVLKELNRVLKPGAKLLVTCPFVWNEHEVPHDYARYTRFGLQDLLNKNGFEVLSISKSGNFITAIFQMYSLFFYTVVYPKVRRWAPLRWAYKFLFVFMINLGGRMMNFLFGNNTSLYLNTVILARKGTNT